MGCFSSIGGTSNVSDDDCEREECEVEPIPSYSDLQSRGVHCISQATFNRVPCEAHGTYPLNPLGDNVIDGKFVCPMIEGDHHGTNQSEMHQI